MRVNYKTHPALNFMDGGTLKEMGIAENDLQAINILRSDISKDWALYFSKISSGLYFLSQPLIEAMSAAREKLSAFEVIENTPSCKGVFIAANGHVEFYNVENKEQEITGCLFIFHKHILTHYLLFNLNKYSEKLKGYGFRSTYLKDNNTASDDISFIFGRINFLKYAEIETKVLSPNTKAKEINCKYLNETKHNVHFVNSTWFTTLIKNNPFWVRGHFRFQPCGEGLKDRKLIFIDPFQKQGYVAPARKLKDQ